MDMLQELDALVATHDRLVLDDRFSDAVFIRQQLRPSLDLIWALEPPDL
jgi:hypothetical protein